MSHRLERSLFERLQQCGYQTQMLTSQYRMHPEIREFPNRYFYQSRLRDAKKVLQRPVPMFVRKMTAALEDGEVRDDSSQWLGRCDTLSCHPGG